MRLLIFEDTCGAGYHCEFIAPGVDSDFIASLVVEGAAMLTAVVWDFAQLRNPEGSTSFDIVTHWDKRGGEPPFQNLNAVQIVEVDSSRSGQLAWNKSLQSCDTVFFIAPEYAGRAYELRQEVHCSGAASLNSSPQAIKLCSDKLELCRHLQEHRISTIPTYFTFEPLAACQYLVAKKRDGVGSMGVQKLPYEKAEQHATSPGSYQLIWQPFIEGEAYSVGCFLNVKSQRLTILPPAKQLLSEDGKFAYQGGEIPATNLCLQSVRDMATQVANSIQGLKGYFGIDFIMDQNNNYIVVEVNPRLTTSYVGYRAMTSQNLAKFLLADAENTEIEWTNHVVFQPDGSTQTRPLTEMERECCRY